MFRVTVRPDPGIDAAVEVHFTSQSLPHLSEFITLRPLIDSTPSDDPNVPEALDRVLPRLKEGGMSSHSIESNNNIIRIFFFGERAGRPESYVEFVRGALASSGWFQVEP